MENQHARSFFKGHGHAHSLFLGLENERAFFKLMKKPMCTMKINVHQLPLVTSQAAKGKEISVRTDFC